MVEFLTDVASTFGSQAEAGGVDIEVEPGGSAPPVALRADVGRLQQVMGNLLANALRHTRRGGKITLRATSTQDGVVSRSRTPAKGYLQTTYPSSSTVFDVGTGHAHMLKRPVEDSASPSPAGSCRLTADRWTSAARSASGLRLASCCRTSGRRRPLTLGEIRSARSASNRSSLCHHREPQHEQSPHPIPHIVLWCAIRRRGPGLRRVDSAPFAYGGTAANDRGALASHRAPGCTHTRRTKHFLLGNS